jgi:hypothetical protein
MRYVVCVYSCTCVRSLTCVHVHDLFSAVTSYNNMYIQFFAYNVLLFQCNERVVELKCSGAVV